MNELDSFPCQVHSVRRDMGLCTNDFKTGRVGPEICHVLLESRSISARPGRVRKCFIEDKRWGKALQGTQEHVVFE